MRRPAPYCGPCNRHHEPRSTELCRSNRLWSLLGCLLLFVACIITGVALGLLSVGIAPGGAL